SSSICAQIYSMGHLDHQVESRCHSPETVMTRVATCMGVSLLSCTVFQAWIATPVPADDNAPMGPEEVLRARGLSPDRGKYLLGEEKGVFQKLRSARAAFADAGEVIARRNGMVQLEIEYDALSQQYIAQLNQVEILKSQTVNISPFPNRRT